MKKKVLLGVLAVCLIFALVSCDDAGFEKLGQLMGGMGNNVYGIKPNMEEVAAVSNTIDNSVTAEKKTDDEGNEKTVINFDLNTASTIITQLSEIGTSTQKLNQAKEDMKVVLKVVTADGTEVESTAIQTALKDKLKEVQKTLPDTTTDVIKEEKVKDVVNQVSSALTTIINNIPDEPTQADLATVVIINSLATKVQELTKDGVNTSDPEVMLPIVDKALAALDALKVTTEVSDLDILGEFNLTSLLSSSSSSSSGDSGDETSKDVTSDDVMKYVKELQENLLKLVSLVSEQNEEGVYVFNQTKYNRFILQMTALRTSYEVATLGLMPSINVSLLQGDADKDTLYDLYEKLSDSSKEVGDVNIFDGLNTAFTTAVTDLNDKGNFNLNDFTLYLLSVVATELSKDDICAVMFESTLPEMLKQFLEDNADNLKQTVITQLDFSAFDTKDDIMLDTSEDADTINILCEDAISLSRTVFVVSLESGWYDTVFQVAKKYSGYKDENVDIDQFLSNCIHELVKLAN